MLCEVGGGEVSVVLVWCGAVGCCRLIVLGDYLGLGHCSSVYSVLLIPMLPVEEVPCQPVN